MKVLGWALMVLTLGGGAPSSHAAEGGAHQSGIGIVLGEPSGLTGKFWTRSDRAIDAGFAFSFDHFVFLYSDYLFHFSPRYGIHPYLGVGGGMLIANGTRATSKNFGDQGSSIGIGLRIPAGAEWFVPRAPFGIFAELVPGLGLIPATYGMFQGGIGARYYFE